MNLNDITKVLVGGQLVLATTQGWTLTRAERINRAGWIAGRWITRPPGVN